MMVRPFDWRDIPTLHRYRNQCLFLDSSLALTSGPVLAPAGALLSSLSPATGVFTYLAHEEAKDQAVLIGQVTHASGQSSARMSFIAPRGEVSLVGLTGMVEAMAVHIGERGALHIVAEVNTQDATYELLRKAGFGTYARQRIWDLEKAKENQRLQGLRRADSGRDTAAIRFLYANLVPGLVQQVEPPPGSRLQGLVYYQGNELLVYIEVRYGPSGIWVQPFVHPDAESVAEPLFQILQNLPNRNSRPVYVCVRTYQSWLDPVIEQLGAKPSPMQAVVVRHLAAARREHAANPMVVLNNKTAEPTVPIVRMRR